MNKSPKGARKKFQRPKEAKRVTSNVDSAFYHDDEIEEYIKTVEDDVLENKYSSSFEGNESIQEILESPRVAPAVRPGSAVNRASLKSNSLLMEEPGNRLSRNSAFKEESVSSMHSVIQEVEESG